MTATARTATVTRTAKLRRAAVVSAAVLAMGAFAGCGGSEDRADKPDAGTSAAAEVQRDAPSSFAADESSSSPSTGAGWDSDYADKAEQDFMAGCESSSDGNTSFCQCAFDEIKQTMTLSEVVRDGLAVLDGESPSQKFLDAVKSCVPEGADSGSPLNLS